MPASLLRHVQIKRHSCAASMRLALFMMMLSFGILLIDATHISIVEFERGTSKGQLKRRMIASGIGSRDVDWDAVFECHCARETQQCLE